MQNVCVKCQALYLPKKLGVMVIETAGEKPTPMRVWSADVLGCPLCGAELLSRFSHEPIIESYNSGFDAFVADIQPGRRYVMYSPALLAQTVKHETIYVRQYGSKNRLRTTHR